MKKTIIVSLFVVSFCALLYFTPHIAIYNMKKAIEKNDPDALSDYIDYVSLRDSLKRSFALNLASTDSGGNLFGLIGTTITTNLISAMMDNLISPEGIAVLLEGKSPVSTINSNSNSSPQSSKKPIMKYGSHNRFEMLFREDGSHSEETKLIFRRHGVFSWRLSSVRLPNTATANFDTVNIGTNPEPPTPEPVNLAPDKQSVKGKFVTNTTAGTLFVITGSVTNTLNVILGKIKVKGTLITTDKVKVKAKIVSCGNLIDEDQLKNVEMSQIDLLLTRETGNNLSNASIQPGRLTPFMIVFSDLPENLENFTVNVEGFDILTSVE